MNFIIEQLETAYVVIMVWVNVFVFVYIVKYAWERAKNASASSRKVCDSCWRDINKVNEKLKNL